MFSDPLSITYDSVALSLPCTGATNPKYAVKNRITSRSYTTSDQQFVVNMTADQLSDGNVLMSVWLKRTQLDNDTNPFVNVAAVGASNSVGVVFVVDKFRYNSTTDIPKLLSALTGFLTAPTVARVIAGEV